MSNVIEALPEGWEEIGFELAIDIVSDNGNKIKKGDYLNEGAFPVIDQGESYIGGYTNEAYAVINQPLPIYVFGDHTRRFKFVNQAFAPGADGVKLLSPTSIWDEKFLYYQLSNLEIENKGYSRHYQILRKKTLKLAPENEQPRIVEKLEELLSDLDNGVAELKAAQKKLVKYRQSLLKSAVEGTLTEQWRKENIASISETGEQLLQRILKERRQSWEGQKQVEFEAKGKTLPNGWQKKYPEPVQPDTNELPELPEGWVWASLDQLIANIDAGKSFKCLERPPEGTDYGVLKVSAVTWGEYDEEESKTCLTKSNENPNILVKKGDFLFSRANTTELVGACVIAEKITKNIMLSDKIWRISFVDDCFKSWTLQYLKGPHGRQQIELSASGNQASMKNISQRKLKSFSIPIASKLEISEIERQIGSVFDQIKTQSESNVIQLQQAEAQRKNIFKEAFSGKLVEQSPIDEPASVLIEKIRTERKEQAKLPKPKRLKKKPNAMTELTNESLKSWINDASDNTFTFDQLQNVFNADYEVLKDILFSTLSDSNPFLEQFFDSEAGHIAFKKV